MTASLFPGPVPQPNDRIEQRIADLERQILELRRTTLNSSTISGTGLTVQGDGVFKVVTASGVTMFYLGPLVAGVTDFRGLLIKREDGSSMFQTGVVGGDPNKTYFAWQDKLGNILLSDDGAAGEGLARPWLTMPTVPVASGAIPMVANTSYVATQSTGAALRQQPYARVQALYRSAGGATGNLRFTINGTPAGSVVTIAAGAFQWTAVQDLALPGGYNSTVRIEVEVEVTNATGTVGAVFIATQRQSP